MQGWRHGLRQFKAAAGCQQRGWSCARTAGVRHGWAGGGAISARCLRPRAASRGPLIGAWPKRAGHYVANGGFKIGFGTAIETARLICDLALDGNDTIPTEFLVPY